MKPVTFAEGVKLAHQIGAHSYIETSAYEGIGTNKCSMMLLDYICGPTNQQNGTSGPVVKIKTKQNTNNFRTFMTCCPQNVHNAIL